MDKQRANQIRCGPYTIVCGAGSPAAAHQVRTSALGVSSDTPCSSAQYNSSVVGYNRMASPAENTPVIRKVC